MLDEVKCKTLECSLKSTKGENMTIEEIGPELRAHIARKYKTLTAAAEAMGVSIAYVSAVVNGRKPPNKAMLDDAGIERFQAPAIYRRKRAVKA
jgi:transcriptional regulator with XRE-family HTH domain